MKRLAGLSIATVGLSMIAAPAWAYIDPGTGTFLLQILAAAVVGVLYFFHRLRERIKELFVRVSGGGRTPSSSDRD